MDEPCLKRAGCSKRTGARVGKAMAWRWEKSTEDLADISRLEGPNSCASTEAVLRGPDFDQLTTSMEGDPEAETRGSGMSSDFRKLLPSTFPVAPTKCTSTPLSSPPTSLLPPAPLEDFLSQIHYPPIDTMNSSYTSTTGAARWENYDVPVPRCKTPQWYYTQDSPGSTHAKSLSSQGRPRTQSFVDSDDSDDGGDEPDVDSGRPVPKLELRPEVLDYNCAPVPEEEAWFEGDERTTAAKQVYRFKKILPPNLSHLDVYNLAERGTDWRELIAYNVSRNLVNGFGKFFDRLIDIARLEADTLDYERNRNLRATMRNRPEVTNDKLRSSPSWTQSPPTGKEEVAGGSQEESRRADEARRHASYLYPVKTQCSLRQYCDFVPTADRKSKSAQEEQALVETTKYFLQRACMRKGESTEHANDRETRLSSEIRSRDVPRSLIAGCYRNVLEREPELLQQAPKKKFLSSISDLERALSEYQGPSRPVGAPSFCQTSKSIPAYSSKLSSKTPSNGKPSDPQNTPPGNLCKGLACPLAPTTKPSPGLSPVGRHLKVACNESPRSGAGRYPDDRSPTLSSSPSSASTPGGSLYRPPTPLPFDSPRVSPGSQPRELPATLAPLRREWRTPAATSVTSPGPPVTFDPSGQARAGQPPANKLECACATPVRPEESPLTRMCAMSRLDFTRLLKAVSSVCEGSTEGRGAEPTSRTSTLATWAAGSRHPSGSSLGEESLAPQRLPGTSSKEAATPSSSMDNPPGERRRLTSRSQHGKAAPRGALPARARRQRGPAPQEARAAGRERGLWTLLGDRAARSEGTEPSLTASSSENHSVSVTSSVTSSSDRGALRTAQGACEVPTWVTPRQASMKSLQWAWRGHANPPRSAASKAPPTATRAWSAPDDSNSAHLGHASSSKKSQLSFHGKLERPEDKGHSQGQQPTSLISTNGKTSGAQSSDRVRCSRAGCSKGGNTNPGSHMTSAVSLVDFRSLTDWRRKKGRGGTHAQSATKGLATPSSSDTVSRRAGHQGRSSKRHFLVPSKGSTVLHGSGGMRSATRKLHFHPGHGAPARRREARVGQGSKRQHGRRNNAKTASQQGQLCYGYVESSPAQAHAHAHAQGQTQARVARRQNASSNHSNNSSCGGSSSNSLLSEGSTSSSASPKPRRSGHRKCRASRRTRSLSPHKMELRLVKSIADRQYTRHERVGILVKGANSSTAKARGPKRSVNFKSRQDRHCQRKQR